MFRSLINRKGRFGSAGILHKIILNENKYIWKMQNHKLVLASSFYLCYFSVCKGVEI